MGANDVQVGGSHYKKGGSFQHWDFISDSYGTGYLIGCATKYLTRWRDKNGVEDLQKAAHYCEKLSEVCTKFGRLFLSEEHVDSFIKANGVKEIEAKIMRQILFAEKSEDFAEASRMIHDLIAAEQMKAAPQDEIVRMTNKIVGSLGECGMHSALTVLCNLQGQIVAAIAEGKPSVLNKQVESVAENIKKAAQLKMFHDHEKTGRK